MYKIIKISFFFIFIGTAIFLCSCIKEEFDPGKVSKEIIIHPTVAAPVGYIHYQLNEILKDSTQSWNMIVDDDGLVNLYYEAEIISLQASEIFQFPELSQSGSIRNSSTLYLDLSKIRYPYNLFEYDTMQFVLSGPDGPDFTDIDSIHVESMVIEIFLAPRFDLYGKMIVSSPKDGPGIYKTNSLGQRIAWGTSFGIPELNEVQTIIVEDITIIPFNDPNGNNLVPLIFEMRLERKPSTGIVPPGNNILSYIFTIKNLNYSAVYGYLGKANFQIDPQAMQIDFYNSVNGSFHFIEPRLNLYFENSFGLPVQVLMTDFYTTNDDGVRTDITGNGFPSGTNIKIIDYPALAEFGMFAYDSMSIPHDGANFAEAMETFPSSLTFGMEARTNTIENDTDNFISDESRLNVQAKLILPLDGYSDLLIVEDSLIFNFDDFFKNPPEEIKALSLRLNFTNGFPVNISTQIYFADENYVVVDSVFEARQLILAGTDKNGDGIVEPLENDPVEVPLSRMQIDHLATCHYLIINGILSTSNFEIPENVRFYSYYFLDAYIGIVGDLELNSTGN